MENWKTVYEKIIDRAKYVTNEEQTKHSLVLPLLDEFLGWDIYDPKHLIAEFTADTPYKRGEKVDYALAKGDEVEVLIEVKPLGKKLGPKEADQLFRYFTTTSTNIAILTDGMKYLFYSDFDLKNRMDHAPFLSLTLEDLGNNKELESLFRLLQFENFNPSLLREKGKQYQEKQKVVELLKNELTSPSQEILEVLFKKMYPSVENTENKMMEFKANVLDAISSINKRKKEKTVEEPQTKTPSKTGGKKRYRQRKGYFQSSEGHKGSEGSLRESWTTFWRDVAKDPNYKQLLTQYAKRKGRPFYTEGGSRRDKISDDLYIDYNLSSKDRENLFKRVSNYLNLETSIVYTDGL